MELAKAAVEARLAACGQVAGPVASTYWWNDELERAEEWFVFFKLPADRYEALAEFLAERHSYDEPEILATPFVARLAVVPRLDHRRDPPARLRRPAAAGPGRIGRARPRQVGRSGRRDVPADDDRVVVLRAEGGDGAGVQPEQPPVDRRQAQPAGGQHPQHVTVRDQGDVAVREQRRGPP